MERNKDVVAWDSQTTITEPDEQGVDDVDEEDSTDEQYMEQSSIFWLENVIFWVNPQFFFKKNDLPPFKKIKKTVFVSDAGRLTAVVSWQSYLTWRTAGSCGN